jgi:hypothetical protein
MVAPACEADDERRAVSVELLIRDGVPEWYLSPDIWVVEVPDPSAPPLSPLPGQKAYVCARVTNNGSEEVQGVRLDYWVADPTAQVMLPQAKQIGTAFATLPPGATRDALCLTRWTAGLINTVHECLVVVAVHPADPLPTPPPLSAAPGFRQIAQKNLTLMKMTAKAQAMVLTVNALPRVGKAVSLAVEIGGALDEPVLAGIGVRGLRAAADARIEVGLSQRRGCVGEGDPIGERELALRVERGAAESVQVNIRDQGLQRDEYQLVKVEERDPDGAVLGGIGLVVVAATEDER